MVKPAKLSACTPLLVTMSTTQQFSLEKNKFNKKIDIQFLLYGHNKPAMTNHYREEIVGKFANCCVRKLPVDCN